MAAEIRLRAELQRSLAFGLIGVSYVAIGTPLKYPSRMLVIQNFTDVDLQFSYTGRTDHLAMRADGSFVFDVTTNKTSETGFFYTAGTHIHVKQIDGAAPTRGRVYVTTHYGARR